MTSPFSYSVIIGLFWKRVNARASLFSALAGIITAIAWVALGMNSTLNVVYPTIAVSYLVGLVFTLMNKAAVRQ